MTELINRAKVSTVRLLCDVYPDNLNAIFEWSGSLHDELSPEFTPNQLIEQGNGEQVILFLIRKIQES